MSRPQPNDPFAWVQAAGLPALVCRPLAEIAPHVFTTRGWPLGSCTPETSAGADEQWREVAAAMDVDASHLVRVRQVHGTMVVVAREPAVEASDADIIVSSSSALALTVQSADCVPILVADRRTGAVAAAHAGWRGLSVRVPAATVAALAREFGSQRKDLVAAIGPAIGACCYEVGADVHQRFVRAGFTGDQLARWFLERPAPSARNPTVFPGLPGLPGPSRNTGPRADHWFFDAWASAREQLQAVGMSTEQIFVAELCTASHSEWFCSYRRDGAPAGRMAAAIRSPRRRP
jgi:purine-nucleoside/S-methyl-5'-thioadenosine phosphorylase / adenosine deaminase